MGSVTVTGTGRISITRYVTRTWRRDHDQYSKILYVNQKQGVIGKVYPPAVSFSAVTSTFENREEQGAPCRQRVHWEVVPMK